MHVRSTFFRVKGYQAGLGANVLLLFRPSKERNKLLLRAWALRESLTKELAPACVVRTMEDDRRMLVPRVEAAFTGAKDPDLWELDIADAGYSNMKTSASKLETKFKLSTKK